MQTESREAILGALSLLNRQNGSAQGKQKDDATTSTQVVPSAKVRSVIDIISRSTAEDVLSGRVDMRSISNDLFNWKTKKSTKLVVKALAGVLVNEERYAHGVEVAAYAAAWSPLLEPDRLVRVINSANNVNVAYAPAPYTLQLFAKLKKLFERYPEERREKLAISLWEEAHSGRWWDITAGDANNQQNNNDTPEIDELVEAFHKKSMHYTPQAITMFSELPQDEDILNTILDYKDSMARNEHVDPDFAVFAASLPWLRPADRPESPVGSLLGTLIYITNEVLEDFKFPEKPKNFKEIFPNIKLYGERLGFPFPNSVTATSERELFPGARLEVVLNQATLADNRTYMGNCTWSYKNRMEAGEYVLYRIHYQGEIYNAAMTLNVNNNTWRVGEINSRFNRGQVPNEIKDNFHNLVTALPANELAGLLHQEKANREALKSNTKRKYSYSLD